MSAHDRRTRHEEPIEWEDISRSVILQPRLPQDRPSPERMAEVRELARPGRIELTSEVYGCGCLMAVAVLAASITLILSFLILAGGPAGAFARGLVQGRLFQGPALSREEVWKMLIAPSLVWIALGIPVILLAVRRWKRHHR
ncbi:MAG: hypothetical protein ACP5SI_13355 [Chloroflexia bacterium]